ncbi:LacI family DNA-binding transcriptional regulator [Pseudonocardia nigra]|uniref:LacI family DNA-binding transcriptional regulator n=1 Tax=Pseudonocardia nigra TaxID=1921578 RepID=UPI001C5EF7CD|nr:LacI family DNA-binding transcriptional regulator [Pseudonocardia nigra]
MGRRSRAAVTLEDVARAAGVSRATASRALIGAGPVTPARQRVRAVAEQLGYSPDPLARALAGGAGSRLVVAVAGPTPEVLRDAYVSRVVSSAALVGDPHGVGVSLQWLPFDGARLLDRLAADRSVRGVVLINPTEPLIDAVPTALHGRIVSVGTGSAAVPMFDVDGSGGAGHIVRHLYTSGRRRIAMITGPDWLPCTRRPAAAYRATLLAAGLPVRIVAGDFTAASGHAGALEVLSRWPDTDAIYAACDATALGAIAALRARGVDVPGDIAVAGFDDVPVAALSGPALTTATHPVEQIAAAAATAVIDSAPVPEATVFGSELVLRESA